MPRSLNRPRNNSIAIFAFAAIIFFGIQILYLSKIQSLLQPETASFQPPSDETLHDVSAVKNLSKDIEWPPNDVETILPENIFTRQYPCFPPRNEQHPTQGTRIYVKLVWNNLHSETFYSFVDYFCSCTSDKYPQWKLNNALIPQFYFGPEYFVKPDLRRILAEFNTTTCGPIFIGTPPDPQITLHTTTYAADWYGANKEFEHLDKLNDPKHIFICHTDAPMVDEEGISNVFFLTPLHRMYIVPSFFPQTIVARSVIALDKNPNKPPVFLVLGSFRVTSGNIKRNIDSLKEATIRHKNKDFTIHFLGGASNRQSNETLAKYLQDTFGDVDAHKIKLTPNSEEDVFMENVGRADVILPLVDESNFVMEYQGGKRLTSAVSWGL
jgi:hypothetical protein